MHWIYRLLRRNRVEKQLDVELRDHIERQVADYRAAGIGESEARRRALLAFGGLDQTKELCRDARGTRWVEDFLQDIRYGVRLFRRNPTFTVAAVLSLALGIGANTAIFTLVDRMMLKPLPVDEPHRLVELLTNTGGNQPSNAHTYQALVYLQSHATSVDVIASTQSDFFVEIGNAPPDHRVGEYVTGDFFQILGVPAALGRTVEPSDDRAGAPSVVMLSHGYWQSHFGADRSVLGRTVRLDDHVFTVVGVAPASFRGLVAARAVDVWVPLWAERLLRRPSWTSDAGYNWLQLAGRVRSGHSVESATAEHSALFYPAVVEPKLAPSTDSERAAQLKSWRPVLESARTGLAVVRQQYGEHLLVLLATSGVVLLIACINVANLLLVRASARRQEIAVRLSLGAGRARVIRQLLTESVLLALAGATAGVMLAYPLCDYLVGFFATSRAALVLDVSPDRRVLTFTAALALITGVLFGLLPALRTSVAASPAIGMQSGTRVAASRDRRVLHRSLVATQVALSVIMLFGGGLLLRSLQNIRSVEKGFDPTSVLLFHADASRSRLDADGLRAMYRDAIVRLEALPGVRSASVSQLTPIWGGGSEGAIVVPASEGGAQQKGRVSVNLVSPGYFASTGTPINRGRGFNWGDTAGRPKVAIVNRSLSTRYFGNESPIGRRVQLRGETVEIVGVAGDALYYGLRGSIPPTIYLHWDQQPDQLLIGQNVRIAQFAIKTDMPPLSLAEAARGAVLAAAPSTGITRVRTFEQQLDGSIVRERVLSALSGFFACLGLVLAAIGLYGVMAYTVARRTSEIGIRMALGAEALQIGGMVIREAAVLMAGGVAVGLVAALMLARTLETMLFGLEPNDPTTAIGVAAIMILTGLTAAYFPSRRAIRINPTLALRAE